MVGRLAWHLLCGAAGRGMAARGSGGAIPMALINPCRFGTVRNGVVANSRIVLVASSRCFYIQTVLFGQRQAWLQMAPDGEDRCGG